MLSMIVSPLRVPFRRGQRVTRRFPDRRWWDCRSLCRRSHLSDDPTDQVDFLVRCHRPALCHSSHLASIPRCGDYRAVSNDHRVLVIHAETSRVVELVCLTPFAVSSSDSDAVLPPPSVGCNEREEKGERLFSDGLVEGIPIWTTR